MSPVRSRTVRLARAASAVILAATVTVFAAPAPAQAAACDVELYYEITGRALQGHRVEVTLVNVSASNVESWGMRFDYHGAFAKAAHRSGWGAEFFLVSPTSFTAMNPGERDGGHYYFYPDMVHEFGFTLPGKASKPLSITMSHPPRPCELQVTLGPPPLP